jgi:hypothetical protein
VARYTFSVLGKDYESDWRRMGSGATCYRVGDMVYSFSDNSDVSKRALAGLDTPHLTYLGKSDDGREDVCVMPWYDDVPSKGKVYGLYKTIQSIYLDVCTLADEREYIPDMHPRERDRRRLADFCLLLDTPFVPASIHTAVCTMIDHVHRQEPGCWIHWDLHPKNVGQTRDKVLILRDPIVVYPGGRG